MNDALVNAVLQIQINAVSFHLLQEERTGGETSVDVKKGLAELNEAINLVDFISNKGVIGKGSFPGTTEDYELRTHSEEIKSLLVKFRNVGLECLQNPQTSGIGTIADERFHDAYVQVLAKAAALDHVLKNYQVNNRAKLRILTLCLFVVWTFVVAAATAGFWRFELRRKVAEESLLVAHTQLLSQAKELTAHRENLEDLVKKRTAELTTVNEQLRVEIAERLQTEETLKESGKQVRFLSSQLLRAQEIERRNLSMELHDELGQAVTVAKFRIRAVEKGLRKDQLELKNDCEQLLEFMNGVIEEVRRISLALSPTVLEDLGLTSAIRWLFSNITRLPAMNVTTDIEEIDHLFHRDQWITIYRIVQEILSNIEKHAQAGHVSANIRSSNDKVVFSIEDDGKGFDLEQISRKEPFEKGLGLTTMGERVRMLSGIFNVWSRPGKGTKLTFSIPVEEKEA